MAHGLSLPAVCRISPLVALSYPRRPDCTLDEAILVFEKAPATFTLPRFAKSKMRTAEGYRNQFAPLFEEAQQSAAKQGVSAATPAQKTPKHSPGRDLLGAAHASRIVTPSRPSPPRRKGLRRDSPRMA